MIKNKIVESLKYITVIFFMKTNYIKYINSLFLYKFCRKVKFPSALVFLKGSKFLARKDSMDIAHLSNFYERETTNFLIKLNPKLFIDVGAHIGRFSIILAKNGSKVISLEPEKSNYSGLAKNVMLNNLSGKINHLNVGCSDRKGELPLNVSLINEGQSSFKDIGKSIKENVKVNELDEICKNMGVKPNEISMIKIDVEGFEINVLKGATRILKEGNPLLIIESNNPESQKLLTDFLKKKRFVLREKLDSRNLVFNKRTL